MDLSLIAADRLAAGQGCLGRGQPCDRHAERGARDVVHADLVAEHDAIGVSAVLAADAHLEVLAMLLLAGLSTFDDAHFNKLAHSLDVDRLKRVDGKDLLIDVGGHE